MTEKGKRQQRYSEEFKFQATKLVVEGGTTYHRAAGQLGVNDWALRCWVKGFRASGHLLPKGQVVPIAEELKAARRELAQLRQENDILKKAAAYFAK